MLHLERTEEMVVCLLHKDLWAAQKWIRWAFPVGKVWFEDRGNKKTRKANIRERLWLRFRSKTVHSPHLFPQGPALCKGKNWYVGHVVCSVSKLGSNNWFSDTHITLPKSTHSIRKNTQMTSTSHRSDSGQSLFGCKVFWESCFFSLSLSSHNCLVYFSRSDFRVTKKSFPKKRWLMSWITRLPGPSEWMNSCNILLQKTL